MDYKETLRDYIKQSGLSLREISRRAKGLGKPVSQAYISQLIKGDVPPPSEDISKVLAEITEGNAEDLVWKGYVEKSPEPVRPILESYIDRREVLAEYVAYSFSDPEQFLNEDEYQVNVQKIKNHFQSLSSEEKIDFLLTSFNVMVLARPDWYRDSLIQFDKLNIPALLHLKMIKELPLNRIPLYDFKQATISDDWVTTDKIADGYGYYFYVIPPDDSMIECGISLGRKVLFKRLPDLEERAKASEENRKPEIKIIPDKPYLIEYENGFLIRFIVENPDKTISLKAGHPEYPSITLGDLTQLDILGIAVLVEASDQDSNNIIFLPTKFNEKSLRQAEYFNILDAYIRISGKTYDEITSYCRQKGFILDDDYISRLVTGEYRIPPKSLSTAIAEACSRSAEPLIFLTDLEHEGKNIIGLPLMHNFCNLENCLQTCSLEPVTDFQMIPDRLKFFLNNTLINSLGFSHEESVSFLKRHNCSGEYMLNWNDPTLRKKLEEVYGPDWQDILSDDNWPSIQLNQALKQVADLVKKCADISEVLERLNLTEYSQQLKEIAEKTRDAIERSIPPQSLDILSIIDSNQLLLGDEVITPSEKERLKDYLKLSLEIIQRDRKEGNAANPNGDPPETNEK